MQSEEALTSSLIGGRYRVLRSLARGSAACTDEVLDTENNRICILKTLRLASMSQWKRLDLFKREARTLAHLEHPQIPALLDYFEHKRETALDCYLVIEHVAGSTLAQRVSQGLHLSEQSCYLIAVQVLQVLNYLHSFNPPVVHRDIKPSNLMLDESGGVHLIDFGGVQEALAIGAGGSTMIGTYGYMAPEQFAGRALPQSDFYGLGATLVYLLSGREPADLPQHDLLLNFRPYVECSERFALWIEHLILPAPEQRFRSAAEALEILQDILPAYRSLSLPAIQKETARAVHVNWSALEREARNAGPEADVPTSEWLSPGSELEARYRIAGVLGQGDIAITYAAERIGDGKPVVIRELHFDKLTHWKSYELFEREFRALSKLEHPALPRLIDHFEQRQDERHRFYLVSERIGGRTLDSKLRQGWRPAEKEVRAIAEQLLKIIAFLQDQDPPLIHRDIKPSNILIDEADRVYLIDFGAVQEAFRLQGGGGSTVIGTYGYMAPEQCVGKAVPASDLYGLGATLIHLLSGHAPAELPHQELKIQFADQVRCSRPLFRWLEKLVAPRLDQRFDSPGHALEILLKLDRMPVGSEQLQARESEILDKNDSAIAIIEDTEGLQLQLRPVLHDYKLLLPLILGSNLAIVPLMITASPMLGFTLAIVLPYLSGLLMFRLKQKGEQYETLINIDPDGFNYCVLRKDPEGETEVLEKLYHPIASVADLFLDQSNVHNRLGLRLQTEGRQAYLMLVTQYPLAANRRRAEYLIERMREALSYYRRQIGMR